MSTRVLRQTRSTTSHILMTSEDASEIACLKVGLSATRTMGSRWPRNTASGRDVMYGFHNRTVASTPPVHTIFSSSEQSKCEQALGIKQCRTRPRVVPRLRSVMAKAVSVVPAHEMTACIAGEYFTIFTASVNTSSDALAMWACRMSQVVIGGSPVCSTSVVGRSVNDTARSARHDTMESNIVWQALRNWIAPTLPLRSPKTRTASFVLSTLKW
mmetsp:Transcript_24890/g.64817  ORF Transcript_24890/g.64817 Transcript_24890/m.64817 type:complete len:214 (-) Transcript_24890:1197-1838(-)